MIYKLQKNFILICTVSLLAVILIVFLLMTFFNVSSMNRNLDILADSVSEGGGRFPDHFDKNPFHQKDSKEEKPGFGFITSETPFATRHFTVWFGEAGDVVNINIEFIHSVTAENAVELAQKVNGEIGSRGWISNYRYKVFAFENGKAIVFIDGSTVRAALLQSVTISGIVLLSCAALVLLLIILLSKRAVRPIAESYERQKRFVTDANHELKTPLTLILANLDIAEAELGKNEWLDDIRAEGNRMAELVNQLVFLSRTDEENRDIQRSRLMLSDITADIVADFKVLAESKEKILKSEIAQGISYIGDEALLRRLVSVLLDNAVKYCDVGGEISVSLQKRRNIVLTVENSYKAAEELELDKLFDRFYRADKARTFTGGYGIGLSIARAIAEKHSGEISAYRNGNSVIGFKVILKI